MYAPIGPLQEIRNRYKTALRERQREILSEHPDLTPEIFPRYLPEEIKHLVMKTSTILMVLIGLAVVTIWSQMFLFVGFSLLFLALATIQMFAYAFWVRTGEQIMNPFVLPYTTMLTLLLALFCLVLWFYILFTM